ncbi:DNA gyrase inhibitor YacG [Acidobacteria bacterium AH-259-L09]|nr:DNA gyrase inhibitor YacG [Acidobacteria bacterium AH-259-L09]
MKGRVPHCPHCDKKVSKDNLFFPFCSQRCRLLDLGKWLDGEYRLPDRKASKTEIEAEE